MVSKHMVNTLPASSRVDSSVLEVFRTLAEGNESARSSATSFLVSHLQSQQKAMSDSCPDLTYSVQRLIKGLSSNRKWARLGFSVAFTQVLRVFDVISVQSVLEGIENHLVITHQDSKNEVGAVYMGKAFGYLALIQSGKLLLGEDRLVAEVVQKLHHISTQKSYLQPVCCHGLACLISKVSDKVFSEHMWPHLQADLTHGWEDCSPSTLLLVYSSDKAHKKNINKHFLTEHWGGPKLLAEKNYASLYKVLLKSAEGHPVIHSVVDVIVGDLTGRNVTPFFDKVVVKLLEGTYSQKYLGLNIYLKMIPAISDSHQFTTTLSPTVMNQLMFHLPRSDSVAHSVCRHIANSLVSKVGNGDKAVDTAILRSFTQIPGKLNFDNITKTHTVSTLLHKVCEESVMEYGESLMSFIDGTDGRSVYSPETKKHAVSQFCSLLTSPQLQNQEWRLKVLQFLLCRTFFTVTCPDNSLPQCHIVPGPIEPTLRQCLRANFYKALNTLATFHHDKRSRADHFQWYVDLVYELVKYADTLLNSTNTVTIHLETDFPEEVLETWNEIVKTSKQIEKKRKKEKTISYHDPFLMLFMYVGLVLLSEPEHVIGVLEDLTACYEKSCQKKKLKHDDEPGWMEVVTEVLVSLMSQRSNLTRVIANTVFSALQAHLSHKALAVVINAVQPKKTLDEQEDILGFDEDAPKEMEPDSVTDETTTTEDTNESDEESDSDDDDEDEDSSEEPEMVVDEAMRETVKAALGKAAVNEDSGGEDNESESDLSDSEMIKLDGKLAEVFLIMRKRNSKEAKEKQKEILLFRSRVLDLVETVVKNPLSASHAMDLQEVLLQLMEAGHKSNKEKQLGDRALGVFRRLVKKQKEIIADDTFEKTTAFVMLENLIQYSRKVNSQDLVRAVSDACLVTIRILIHQQLDAPPSRITRSKSKPMSADKETEYLDKVLDTVRSSLSDFLYRRDHRLHMVFFHNMMQKHPMMFWPLTDVLLQSLGDDKVKVHSKTQACALLSALFRGGKQLTEDIGEENWGPFFKELSQTLHKLLLGLSPDNIKPKYTLEMLRVVARLFVIHPDTAHKLVDNEVIEKLESIKSHLGKDTRCECNKILNLIRPKTGKKKKQKKKKKQLKKNNGLQSDIVAEEWSDLALTNGTGADNSVDHLLSADSDSTSKGKLSRDTDPASVQTSPRKRKSSDEEVPVSPKKQKKKRVHKKK